MEVKDFDLGLSAMSGQPLAFYSDYRRSGATEILTYPTQLGRITVSASKRGCVSSVRSSCSESHYKAAAEREVVERFALDEDLSDVYARIDTDPFMSQAISELSGLRVTKNDPWETVLCFVISQFNNIKRIRGIVGNLSKAFGEEIRPDGETMHLIPTPAALASADLSAIRRCGTGFRDRYIKRVAEECSTRVDLGELYDLDYAEAKERLLALHGIGDKVADCILLFGYRKLEAFPIDTWVKRVVETKYFKGRKRSIRQIHSFAERRWGDLSGYANQYIFYQGRLNKIGT